MIGDVELKVRFGKPPSKTAGGVEEEFSRTRGSTQKAVVRDGGGRGRHVRLNKRLDSETRRPRRPGAWRKSLVEHETRFRNPPSKTAGGMEDLFSCTKGMIQKPAVQDGEGRVGSVQLS